MGQCQEFYGNLKVPGVLGKIRRKLARVNSDNDLIIVVYVVLSTKRSASLSPVSSAVNWRSTITLLQHRVDGSGTKKEGTSNSKTSKRRNRAQSRECTFCEGGHISSNGSTYKSADSRLSVVKEKRSCLTL